MSDTNTVVSIDGFDEKSVQKFAPILRQFLIAYTEKSTEINFEDWLNRELHSHLNDKSDVDIKLLTSQIVQGVDSFSDNLQALNSAIESGVSKEDWLIHNLKAVATQNNLEPHDFANHLTQIYHALHDTNQAIVDALQSNSGGIIKLNADSVLADKIIPDNQWNNLNTSALVVDIAKQTSFNDLANNALSTGINLALNSTEAENNSNLVAISKALLSGNDDEIKKTASAALNVAINRGIFPSVPKDIPANVFSSISAMGIENAKIFYHAGTGQLSPLQAIDLTARNYVALVSGFSCEKIGASIGASVLSFIPVVGTTVGGIVGGLVGRFAGNKITQTIKRGVAKVKSVAVSVAKSTWYTITSSVKAIGRGIKSVGRAIASFFGF